jgi:hypothetical protein
MEEIMKKVWFSILMGILLITVMLSFSYAQSCCSAGSACCSVPNVSAAENQIRVSSPVAPQMKTRTTNQQPPQLNTMPWAAAANQIGGLQRLIPTASGSQIESKSRSYRGVSTVTEILASGPFFGTLW